MILRNYLLSLLSQINDAVFIGSLGEISKALIKIGDKNNKIIPVRGAMGCVMGVGLGYAMNTDKIVYVLIGDGAFLMKMGSIATILKYELPNLKIIVLDNGKHASCGGQETNFKHIAQYLPNSIRIVKINENIHSR